MLGSRDGRWARAGLAAGGAGLVLSCAALAAIPNLAEAPGAFLGIFAAACAAYGVGLLGLRRLDGRRALVAALAVAGACRLALLPAPPTLSTDAYRYVWDARVAGAGIDPYTTAPLDAAVAHLRDEAIFPRLNHPEWRTLYPPAAHLFFRAVYRVAPDSVAAMKLGIGLAEVAGLAALVLLVRALGLPAWRVAVYAWHPLVLVETWGSAHVDALAVAAVVLAALAAARSRHALAGAALALATLVKLYPALLLPLLLRSGGRRALLPFALLLGAGYLPLAWRGLDALGSLPRYLVEEHFNPGLARTLLPWPAVPPLAMVAWAAWAGWRPRATTLVAAAVPLVGGVVLLEPNVFPWYVLWLVPFLALAPSLPWLGFTLAVACAYAFFLQQPWDIPGWARAAQALPLALGAAGWLRGRLAGGAPARPPAPGPPAAARLAADPAAAPEPGRRGPASNAPGPDGGQDRQRPGRPTWSR
jgi:hypothetical protein